MKRARKPRWDADARACFPGLPPSRPSSYALLYHRCQILVPLEDVDACLVLREVDMPSLYEHLESMLFTPKERLLLIKERIKIRRHRRKKGSHARTD